MKSPSNDRWVSYLVAATAAVLVLLFGLQRFGIWQPSEVHVADLARDLIRLSGFTPGIDIQIQYTGMRPGEKLFEELSVSSENADKTRHPKIFVGHRRPADDDAVVRATDALVARADGKNAVTLKGEMQSIVPEYTPDIETLASVPPTAVPPVIVENDAEPEAKRAAVIPIRR